MKKFTFFAACLLMAISASATKYVVWSGDDLATDEVQLPLDWYGWWNMDPKTVDDATSAEGKAVVWTTNEKTGVGSAGIYIGDNGHTFPMATLAPMDLVFNAKLTGTAKWTLRLTGAATGDVDYVLTTPQDGEWHEVRLNIAECYPKIYSDWSLAETEKGYVFALIMEGGTADAAAYTSDMHYESAIDMPSVVCTVGDVTSTTATVTYNVTFPAGYTNTAVTVNGNPADASATLALTDLTPQTTYTYVVVATGELDGKTYSAEQTVTFTTKREAGSDAVFSDYVKARFNNAYRAGETAEDARTIALSLPFSLTYTSEGTLLYEIDLTQAADIVGLVPQIYWNGFHALTKGDDNVWSFDFGALEDGSSIVISHYLAYAGGVVDLNFGALYSQVGQTQAAPAIGEAATMELTAAKRVVRVAEGNLLTAIVADAAGYYLSADAVEFETPAGVVMDGAKAVASERGTYTVTAKSGALQATVTFVCGMSESATDVAHGVEAYDFSAAQDGADIKWITDGNDGAPEVIWACSETEAHHVYLDLGNVYFIECVAPVWEGAYAVDYKVLLSTEALPAASEAIEVTGNNTTVPVHVLDTAIPARYIGIETSKALNTGWGIKLRELHVYGTTEPSGIADILDGADQTVEYYTISGMRVNGNLTPGIYIMRQGSKAVKMIVK